jgi:hypothetical protein
MTVPQSESKGFFILLLSFRDVMCDFPDAVCQAEGGAGSRMNHRWKGCENPHQSAIRPLNGGAILAFI